MALGAYFDVGWFVADITGLDNLSMMSWDVCFGISIDGLNATIARILCSYYFGGTCHKSMRILGGCTNAQEFLVMFARLSNLISCHCSKNDEMHVTLFAEEYHVAFWLLGISCRLSMQLVIQFQGWQIIICLSFWPSLFLRTFLIILEWNQFVTYSSLPPTMRSFLFRSLWTDTKIFGDLSCNVVVYFVFEHYLL